MTHGALGRYRSRKVWPHRSSKTTSASAIRRTGLGLSISYDIVTQQHGGTVDIDSRVGEFTEFTVRLPRAFRANMAEVAS